MLVSGLDKNNATPGRRFRAAWAAAGIGLASIGLILSSRSHAGRLRHLPAPPPLPSIEAEPVTGTPSVTAPRPLPHFVETLDVSTFQKGNIHTHSTRSDGDAPPQDVYAWYREHGYNFVALTDHNILTDPAIYRLLERKRRFILIPGEEISMRGAGKQVHVNGLCTRRTIGGKLFDTQQQALSWAVREVRAQGGVALVNHPNWDWALTAAELPAARGAALLEIWSGHPFVHTQGDESHLSHESIWDVALGSGEPLSGVAVDDAHVYGRKAPETAARPGRGWVQVFSAELTPKAVCAALAAGRLYSSNGITLKRILVDRDTYVVWPADQGTMVEFIGKSGLVLQNQPPDADGAARYKLKGGEGMIRARITRPDGRQAWTQPVRVEP